MMANAVHDPYNLASVRGEILSNPDLQAVIEDTCSKCHMPMARYTAITEESKGKYFDDGFLDSKNQFYSLAIDGVSCTLCHQFRILPAGFDKKLASADVTDHGEAVDDKDFIEGGDSVHYTINIGTARSRYTISAELLYQSIGFRWAQNLRRDNISESTRFFQYYSNLPNLPATIARTAIIVQ